jgi:hypothetical protein
VQLISSNITTAVENSRSRGSAWGSTVISNATPLFVQAANEACYPAHGYSEQSGLEPQRGFSPQIGEDREIDTISALDGPPLEHLRVTPKLCSIVVAHTDTV